MRLGRCQNFIDLSSWDRTFQNGRGTPTLKITRVPLGQGFWYYKTKILDRSPISFRKQRITSRRLESFIVTVRDSFCGYLILLFLSPWVQWHYKKFLSKDWDVPNLNSGCPDHVLVPEGRTEGRKSQIPDGGMTKINGIKNGHPDRRSQEQWKGRFQGIGEEVKGTHWIWVKQRSKRFYSFYYEGVRSRRTQLPVFLQYQWTSRPS